MKKINFLIFLIISIVAVNSLHNQLYFVNQNILKNSSIDFMNVKIISENSVDILWNSNSSLDPEIFVDSTGKIHVVWEDDTNGLWGNDTEIMYASSIDGKTWSNATIVSDGFNGTYWNDGRSENPCIVVDSLNRIFVVWQDDTNGLWGNDTEIMYTSSSDGISWSNATIVSDGFNGTYWNDGRSENPDLAIDIHDKLHIVWSDVSDGKWKTQSYDSDIMYCSIIEGYELTNITIISDGYNGLYWNDANSDWPSLFVDDYEVAHVVWTDSTGGIWGTDGADMEIMYSTYVDGIGITNATVISDGYNNVYWNDDGSYFPSICVNSTGGIHIVWQDHTDGIWGNDTEIMYVSSSDGISWSNVTIISDGFNGIYWNNGESWMPTIAIDQYNNIKISWNDHTDGIWGLDSEVMYVSSTNGLSWSNITVISDGFNEIYWNQDVSSNQAITFDQWGNLHIVWQDSTDGIWGNDTEIMYTFISFKIDFQIDLAFYINFILSFIFLGLIASLIGIERLSQNRIKSSSIYKSTLINISKLVLPITVISFQVSQIQTNSKVDISTQFENPLVFFLPYILLLITLLVLLLVSISLVISINEYKSYLKSKNIEQKAFRRISFDKIFENETRQKIVEKILNNSEIHYKELLRDCHLSNGQLQWHLDVLLEYGIIKIRKVGQYNIYSPIYNNFESSKYNNIIIKSETSLTILDLIEKTPGIIPSIIADKLNVKRSTINYHIRKLVKRNLIRTVKSGKYLKLYLENNDLFVD